MAVLYLKSAGGLWSAAGTWSTTSAAGADNSGPPLASTDVILELLSGALTIDAGAVCRSINLNSGTGGYNNTITHTAAVTLTIGDATAGAGSKALDFSGAGGSFSYALGATDSSALVFVSTSATVQTINSGGKNVGNFTTGTNSGTGGSWQLTNGITQSGAGQITFRNGTIDTNGQAIVTTQTLSLANVGNTKVVTLGSSSITITGTTKNWDFSTNAITTVSAASATITLSGSANQFLGGGFTYGTLIFTGANTGAWTVTGANTFTTVTVSGGANKTGSLTFSANQTINGTLTLNGNSTTNRILVTSDTLGTARTLTAATVVASNVDFRNIYGAGAAATANPVGGYYVSRKSAVKPQWPFTLNRASDQAQGLIGWWPGGPSGGPKLWDFSGRGNHGTIASGPLWTPGYNGGKNALQFNGTPTGGSGGINTGSATLADNLGAMTIAFWFKTPSYTASLGIDAVMLGKMSNFTNSAGWQITQSAANDNDNPHGISLAYQDAGGNNWIVKFITTAVDTNTWWHFAWTVSGGPGNAAIFTAYLNGKSQTLGDLSSGTFSSITTATNVIFGRDGNATAGSFYPGILEDVRIYNRTLTGSEVYSLYNPSTRWQLRDIPAKIKATMSATWDLSAITGGSGDCGGNSGITFTTGATQNATIAGAKNWSDATIWTSRVPLPQDDCTFTGWTSGTLTADMPRLGRNIDFSGATAGRTLIMTSVANTIYGSFNLTRVTTLTTVGQSITFEGRSSFILTSVGLTFSGSHIIQMVGGTLTLQDDYNFDSGRTLTLNNGTINANGHNVTVPNFLSSNSNVRTITFGSGTWTLTGNNSVVWTTAIATSLTLNRGNPIVFNYSGSTGSRGIRHGGQGGGSESNSIDVSVTAGTDGVDFSAGTAVFFRNVDFTGYAGTFSNNTLNSYGNLTLSTGMSLTAGTNATTFGATSSTQVITSNTKTMDFPITVNAPGATVQLADNLTVGSTRTVTLTAGTLDANGKNFTMGFFNSNNTNVRTITFGSGTWTVTGSGASVWQTDNALNLTVNRGNPIISNYSGSTGTRTFVASGTNGTESNVVDISITAGTDTVSIFGGLRKWRNIDFTGFAGTWTNADIWIFGNLTLSTGMTVGTGANEVSFTSTSGTKTITSNGKTMDFPVTFAGVSGTGGTWQLLDDMTVGATRTVTLTAGTIDANNHNIKTGIFTAGSTGNTRAILMGTGTWEVNGTGVITVWDTSAATGITITPSTSTIKISGSSASIRTFKGGGFTYGNVWITNATTGGETDFTGSNTFLDFKQQDVTPQTIKFTAGTSTTVSSWSAFGTASNLLTIGSITAAGHTLTITGTTIVSADYLSISRSTATPLFRTWYAGTHSTDGGNNSGWIFTGAPPRFQYIISNFTSREIAGSW